jgi:predicted lipoprotein with Yx(FWY)xxD motif
MKIQVWAVVAAGALAAGGCSASAKPGAPASSAALSGVETLSVVSTGKGSGLALSNKRMVYDFDRDTTISSACSGICATLWPPVTGTVHAGQGVDSSKLGAIARIDGSQQVTYAGHPLYIYSKDTAPGQTLGDDVDGMWHVVMMSPAAGPSAPTGTGGYGGGY